MRLEREGKDPMDDVTAKQLRRAIRSLRSYGPSSFASLTDDDGNYLQVAGGGVTSMLERYDAKTGQRFRAFHDKPSQVFPDGTLLVFGAGKIAMRADEWFTADVVLEVFTAFLEGRQLPHNVYWRPAPGF